MDWEGETCGIEGEEGSDFLGGGRLANGENVSMFIFGE